MGSMSRLTEETIERVRDAVDFVEVVSAHTDLRRQGERFVGLCPFHEERTPSFSVDPREKLYYCFGCEAGGNVFRFLEEKEGLSFADAVEALADRYGVEVERESEDPRAEAARRRRARLGELLDRTAAFYSHYLWQAPKAAKARDYLAGRGLGEEVLRAFEVGFAPSAWDQVLTRGQRAGFSIEELRDAGLVQRGRQGGFYDRFRTRITFPVRDPRGRVQGFGARDMRRDPKPKYLNSPEGALYRKSRTLFGIDRARGPIARSGRGIVVEGYTDVLALHQAGIEEAVAVMGTAITPEQIGLAAGYAEELVLALDADRAGRAAMLRAQRVARGRNLRLRVATMPEGEDPAGMLAERGGAERFRELVEAAEEMPAFHVRTILEGAELETPAGRDAALDEAIPVLAAMGETISRDELARRVADRLDADPGLVARRVRGARPEPAPAGEAAGGRPERAAARPGAVGGSGEQSAGVGAVGAAAGADDAGRGGADGRGDGRTARARRPPPPRPHERRERALLAMCIAVPDVGATYIERLRPEHLSGPVAARALDWLREHLAEPASGLPRDDPDLVSLVTQLKMAAEREPASPEAMELNFLELERRAVERRIAASREGGGDPPVELQRKRAELNDRIAHHRSI